MCITNIQTMMSISYFALHICIHVECNRHINDPCPNLRIFLEDNQYFNKGVLLPMCMLITGKVCSCVGVCTADKYKFSQ